MSETTEAEREARRREPSPLVAEVEGRLRDIVQNGAEPWNDPAEVRREARRRDMEMLRLSGMESALHTNEYICGRLPNWKREAFEKVADPLASLANLNRSIVQITLAEDRFDESREERAARLKAEAEARVRAERADEAERTLIRAEKKRHIQQTVRAITLDHIRLPYDDRETMFDALFRSMDADGSYDAEPAEIVADVVARFGIVSRIVPDAEIKTADGKIDLAARKARVTAFAQTYLDLMKPAGPDDDGEFAQGQGPPH